MFKYTERIPKFEIVQTYVCYSFGELNIQNQSPMRPVKCLSVSNKENY